MKLKFFLKKINKVIKLVGVSMPKLYDAGITLYK